MDLLKKMSMEGNQAISKRTNSQIHSSCIVCSMYEVSMKYAGVQIRSEKVTA